MIYSRLRQRQRIVEECILKRQQEKLESVQLGLSDPFQMYYYPAPLEEPEQLYKLEKLIQSKIKEVQNIRKLSEAQSLLKEQVALVESKIDAQKEELAMLNYLISSIQDKITRYDINNSINVIKKQTKYLVNTSIQTKCIQKKQKSIECKINTDIHSNFTQTKCAQLFSTSAYSLTIQNQICPGHLQPNHNFHSKMIKKQNATRNQLKFLTFPKNTHLNNTINTLYAQLQKQISYLQHVKREKNKKKYAEQKKKVAFMIELFWKNAQQNGNDQSQMSLPLIQL